MTEATQTRPSPPPRAELAIDYQVAMPQPTSHLFEVTLTLRGWQADQLDLKMPVWTPGSYLVREYARHVQDFEAEAIAGSTVLTWQKMSKNHWRVDTTTASDLTIHYRVFANELTVRTNHLDATHGYFNGAALFFYIPGLMHHPLKVTIVPPDPDWQVATPLPPVTGQSHTFLAANFDTLVDSPFEIGLHQQYEFEVQGKPHRFVVWGEGNLNPDPMLTDTRRIIETESALFGGLPYDRYLFILHLTGQGFGGLEHKTSCSLIYSRFGFQNTERYQRFMQLVAHEFFHLWNIKRIRPKALETFNYDQENYTPSLWFSEGTTSYYDLLIPLRAGVYDATVFLKSLEKEISRYLTTPGRFVQPLSESSFDAWIKLYRRDANSDNSQISYYLKGEMVSLLLDLHIRDRHDNQRSMDDVLRQLWHQFGQSEIGFTPQQLEAVIESVAGESLQSLFQTCLHRTDELPLAPYLEAFGLQIQPESNSTPFLGLTVKSETGRDMIKFVEANSPGEQAGLIAEDELLAIDGIRVKASDLTDRLQDYQPGDTVQITVFHQDELLTRSATLAPPRPTAYHLRPVDNPSPRQTRNLTAWLGTDWEQIFAFDSSSGLGKP